MVKISIKWGKNIYNDIEIDKNDSVMTLKAQIFALTNVPIERQKLLSKTAWKGMLKDNENLNNLSKLVDGTQIVLMGSADTLIIPEKKTIFIEDMMKSGIPLENTNHFPTGLTNLGNTCYLNSSLQCLRYIPELRDSINKLNSNNNITNNNDLATNIVTTLRDTFNQLDFTIDSVSPSQFIDTFRKAYPQFNEKTSRGEYMQQDSDEFLSSLLTTLGQKLTNVENNTNNPSSKNVIEALLGIETKETLKCIECDAEPETFRMDKAIKLVCNINKDTNHLTEGIQLSLNCEIVKRSDILNKNNAKWKKLVKINRLPKYLCVQFLRFYWKLTPDSMDHSGVKCKMLKPISFPLVLDTYDFCSEELQKVLKVGRDKHADKILNEKEEKKEETISDKNQTMQSIPTNNSLPSDFQGFYELFALVTHKGRSADSGHYIGWTRVKDDDWLCFDDDEVTPCKTEDILNLKGGGDWHMAYIAFYRVKN